MKSAPFTIYIIAHINRSILLPPHWWSTTVGSDVHKDTSLLIHFI